MERVFWDGRKPFQDRTNALAMKPGRRSHARLATNSAAASHSTAASALTLTTCIKMPVTNGPPLLATPQVALTMPLAATRRWPLKRSPQATSAST